MQDDALASGMCRDDFKDNYDYPPLASGRADPC